jgi:SprT-like protein
MRDEQLQRWVEQISLQYFGRPFLHRATFNSRLRSTGGRYFTATHHIEISSRHLEVFGPEEVERIIKHELCHYHLHLTNKGYRHRDRDFKELLARVGGTRYCRPAAPRKAREYRYLLTCVDCGTEYRRKRRMNTARYVCGRCRGRLTIQKILPQKT